MCSLSHFHKYCSYIKDNSITLKHSSSCNKEKHVLKLLYLIPSIEINIQKKAHYVDDEMYTNQIIITYCYSAQNIVQKFSCSNILNNMSNKMIVNPKNYEIIGAQNFVFEPYLTDFKFDIIDPLNRDFFFYYESTCCLD